MLIEKGGRMDAASSTVKILCLEGRIEEIFEQRRILSVCHELKTGAVSTILLRLVEYLQRKGCKVDSWSIRGGVLDESFNKYVANCATEIRRACIRQKTPYEEIIGATHGCPQLTYKLRRKV